jgi:hypothetical protein
MLAKQEKITHILMVHAFMDIHGHWGGLLLLYQHKRIVSESRIQDVEVPLQLCAALQVGHIAACPVGSVMARQATFSPFTQGGMTRAFNSSPCSCGRGAINT